MLSVYVWKHHKSSLYNLYTLIYTNEREREKERERGGREKERERSLAMKSKALASCSFNWLPYS
jgi:hypothetical protein